MKLLIFFYFMHFKPDKSSVSACSGGVIIYLSPKFSCPNALQKNFIPYF